MCFFLGEYTTGGGYQFSPTNQLIWNLKKSVDRRGRPEWHHHDRTALLQGGMAPYRRRFGIRLADGTNSRRSNRWSC